MATPETPNPEDRLSSQPKDIMYNIFLRLPVKTLLILQSVCKSWYSLIWSPDFITTQLSVSPDDPHFTHHCLMLGDWTYELQCDVPCLHFSTCSVYSLLHEPFPETFPCDDHLGFRSIVGNCNGLLVGKDWFESNQLFLWNPSTREIKDLPELNWICFMPCTKYGFCYDASDDDYKVFAISPARPDYNISDLSRTHYEYKVYVYSLKCDCWRMTGDFPFRLICCDYYLPGLDDGKFANGSLYWTVITEPNKMIIVSLDIKTEMWEEVLPPKFGDGVYRWTLGTFGKNLSVLCQFETHYDLWIMKECGVEVSWRKLFTIPFMNELMTSHSLLDPICISDNGEIMLKLNATVVLYNSKDQTFKNLLTDREFVNLYVYTYVESLVSPHLYSDEE